MKFRRDPHETETATAVARVVETAESWLGYKPQPGLMTTFGRETGYDSHPWAGSFIDVVFHSADVTIPSCVYTPAALAEFLRLNRFFPADKPELGDIAFFCFPTGQESKFAMPHAGIVTAVSAHSLNGMIRTVEGHMVTGNPKAPNQTQPGVFARGRTPHEIIGFGRPDYSPQVDAPSLDGQPAVMMAFLQPGRRNLQIAVLHEALSRAVGFRFAYELVDHYGTETSRAYSRWQRILGYVGDDANGIPDLASLTRLGVTTGLFSVQA